jgi:hypothetical protein
MSHQYVLGKGKDKLCCWLKKYHYTLLGVHVCIIVQQKVSNCCSIFENDLQFLPQYAGLTNTPKIGQGSPRKTRQLSSVTGQIW